MVEISSDGEFRQWLEGKPQEVAVCLAARIALRVLPLWHAILPRVGEKARADILSVVR